jgi:hypothetical protein
MSQVSDPIIDALELVNEDRGWLPDLYSLIANTERILPRVHRWGHRHPEPIGVNIYDPANARFNPETNSYEARGPSREGRVHCPVYSSQELFKLAGPLLREHLKEIGEMVEPLVLNGRQIINLCFRWNQCATINHTLKNVPFYHLSFEEMGKIRRCAIRPQPAPKYEDWALTVFGPNHEQRTRYVMAQRAADYLGVSLSTFLRHIKKIKASGQHLGPLYKETSYIGPQGRTQATRLYTEEAVWLVSQFISGEKGFQVRAKMSQFMTEQLAEAQSIIQAYTDRSLNTAFLEDKSETGLLKLQDRLKEVLAEQSRLVAENKRLASELQNRDRLIRELRDNLSAVLDFSSPSTVLEACEDAARRYGSRLVIHPRVLEAVDAWPHNRNSKCVSQALTMFKALALVLYPMKYESADGRINPGQFEDLTGCPLAMTEGKLTKRDKSFEEIRTCEYEGRKITFYPHLKATIQKIQMRLYFNFLEDRQKIIVCHVGEHLANSQSRNL